MTWTAPRTWVAGEKPTAATLNTHIRDNLKAIGDAWTSFTSTPGNFTVGNGTTTAASMQAGKLTHFWIKFVFGSTSSMTGSPTFTLPVAGTARMVIARVLMYDTSAASYKGGFCFNSGASSLVVRDDASAAISSTNPITWATGDELVITGTYEAA